MKNQDLPYRPNVCLLIYNQAKELFLGERSDIANAWQFPQGGVEMSKGTIEDNVIAESSEELGVDPGLFEIKFRLQASFQYDFARPPEYAQGIWRGQKQSFWVVSFSGNDEDIKLDRYETEFRAFFWCPPEEALERVSPIRVKGYEKPLVEFIELRDSGLL